MHVVGSCSRISNIYLNACFLYTIEFLNMIIYFLENVVIQKIVGLTNNVVGKNSFKFLLHSEFVLICSLNSLVIF